MRPAAEQAAASLRDEILSGAIASGTRLGEVELAGRLSVSRTPIREALSRLDADQLAELDDLAAAMMRAGKPGRAQDLTAIVELDRRFHGTFIDAAGSPPPAGALRGVTHAAVVHQNFHDYTADALSRSLHHHVEMVAAARAGDGDWAEAVMRAHLHNARATMIGGHR